jgi:hypothetical protein
MRSAAPRGPLFELAADGKGWLLEPRAQGAHPRVDGVWLVCKDAAPTFLGASCLQADIVYGISPVDGDECRQLIPRSWDSTSPARLPDTKDLPSYAVSCIAAKTARRSSMSARQVCS